MEGYRLKFLFKKLNLVAILVDFEGTKFLNKKVKIQRLFPILSLFIELGRMRSYEVDLEGEKMQKISVKSCK